MKKEKKLLQAKDILKELPVSREKLKFYERKGLIRPERRTSSGYRLYPVDIVTRLRFIKAAQDLGFTLKEIGGLLAPGSKHLKGRGAWIKLARQKLVLLEEKINTLEQMKSSLQEYIEDPAAWENDEACSPLFDVLRKEQTYE